jgi:hypothetical protein
MADVNSSDYRLPGDARLEAIASSGARTPVPVLFEGFADRQLSIKASQPIAAFTLVSLEYGDVLFLGEVRRCHPIDPHSFKVEIDVEQIVNSLTTLMRLRSSLLEANIPTPSDLLSQYVGVGLSF